MTIRVSNPASVATGEAKIELNPENLDPVLLKLGLLIGILKKDGSHTVFNTDWLKDPIASLKQIPTARRQELLDVLERAIVAPHVAGYGAAARGEVLGQHDRLAAELKARAADVGAEHALELLDRRTALLGLGGDREREKSR